MAVFLDDPSRNRAGLLLFIAVMGGGDAGLSAIVCLIFDDGLPYRNAGSCSEARTVETYRHTRSC